VFPIPHIFSILFGAAFTVTVMWAIGGLLFGWLGISLRAIEHDLLAGATGAALLSAAVFVLCSLNAARTVVFLGLAIAALAANWRYGARSTGELPPVPRLWKWIFATLFGIFAVFYLANSLAPEISPDGAAYHLGFVFRYFREHGFHRITANLYGSLSKGAEMLFLFAFAFGRHSAAATVHCCYLLALPILILSYARRIGKPRAGVCAAMLTFLSPLIGIDGVSAYIDVALAGTAFAMFYLLEIWREKDDGGNGDKSALLIPIGLLAGFCFAIKATGVVALLYAATVIVWNRRPRALVNVAVAAAIVALPWPIMNWVWLANPMSPFMNSLFPNPGIHVQFEREYRSYLTHYELSSLRQWPWEVTAGGALAGPLGPVFLLAPIALFALRSSAGRRCLLAALFFSALYPLNIDARFLIPAIPFVSLAMVLALEAFQPALILLTVAAAILALPPVIDFYRGPAAWRIGYFPWQAALRIIPQDRYLGQSLAWISASMVEAYVPKGKRIWSTTPIAESYTSADIIVNYESAEGELIEDMIKAPLNPAVSATENLRFSFPKQRMSHLRLLQQAAGQGLSNPWSITELRVFNGPDEITRQPEWHLDAKPYPWDIGFAFDGNPATRWRSWETFQPGMHVDVDFGKPLEIDRVELHCSRDQAGVRVQPQVCGEGRCATVHADLEILNDVPAGGLRGDAIRAVKSRGIDFLIIDDGYTTAADMAKDPAAWGLDAIAVRASNRLYRIP
jgi:hypothetical protein